MKYEKPIIQLIETEDEDIITLSPGGDFVKDLVEDGSWI